MFINYIDRYYRLIQYYDNMDINIIIYTMQYFDINTNICLHVFKCINKENIIVNNFDMFQILLEIIHKQLIIYE